MVWDKRRWAALSLEQDFSHQELLLWRPCPGYRPPGSHEYPNTPVSEWASAFYLAQMQRNLAFCASLLLLQLTQLHVGVPRVKKRRLFCASSVPLGELLTGPGIGAPSPLCSVMPLLLTPHVRGKLRLCVACAHSHSWGKAAGKARLA